MKCKHMMRDLKRITSFILCYAMLFTLYPFFSYAEYSEEMNLLKIQEKEEQIENLFHERNNAYYELLHLLELEEVSDADYRAVLETRNGNVMTSNSSISNDIQSLICKYADKMEAAESKLFELGVIKVTPEDQKSVDLLTEIFQNEYQNDSLITPMASWIPSIETHVNRLITHYDVFITYTATMGLSDPAGSGTLYYDTAVVKVTHKEGGKLGLVNTKSTDTILAEKIATKEKWDSFLQSSVSLIVESGVSVLPLGGWQYAISGAFFVVNSLFPALSNPNFGPVSTEDAYYLSLITTTTEMTYLYAKPKFNNPLNEWILLGSHSYVYCVETQVIRYFNGTYADHMTADTKANYTKGSLSLPHFLSNLNSKIHNLVDFAPINNNAGSVRYTGFSRSYTHTPKIYSHPLLIPIT